MKWFFLVYDCNDNMTRVHSLELKRGSSTYTQLVSLSAFNGRELKRKFGDAGEDHNRVQYTSVCREDDVQRWQETYAACGKDFFQTHIEQKHADLWSLYAAIGYDYKKQKYN